MNAYILITFAVILLAGDFVLQNLYRTKMGTEITTGLVFNIFSGLFTTVIFFFINGCKITFSGYSAIMACVMSMLCITYTLIGFRVMKTGNMAYYTLALMAGGMTVPYIYGLMFLSEDFLWLRLIGLIMILVAVVGSNISGEKTDKKLIIYCCAVFFLNGFVSVVSKLHQINETFNHVPANEFVMYTGIMRMILSSLALLVLKNKTEKKKQSVTYSAIGITVLSALVSGTSYMLQLIGAEKLPASVLYPFITGGSIVLSSLAGVVFFKEKLSKKIIICVIICFVGTCLFI